MSLFSDIAIGGGSLVSAGAGLLGAYEQSKAAKRGMDAAEDAYRDQTTALAPYREVGGMALGDLRDIYLTGEKDFTEAPGYDFRMNEGLKALDRSAAARGRLRSGPHSKAVQRYGQDYATSEYDRGFGRLAQLAGYGTGAVSQGNQAAGNLAINLGRGYADQGAARASGYAAPASAINQGINNMLTLRAMEGWV